MIAASEVLKAKGLKATPQRIAIYKALTSTTSHPDAETLYNMMKLDFPTMSLNTIYTTLCALEEAGLARRIDAGNGARYDGNPAPHAHIICTQCLRVDDLAAQVDTAVDGWPQKVEAASGYSVRDFAVYFYGICPACRSNDPA